MATTISFPTVVSENDIAADKWFDDNNQLNGDGFNSNIENITLSSFNSLSIPQGATINGIEVIVDGLGNAPSGDPELKLIYFDLSSETNIETDPLPFNSQFQRSSLLFDPGWGSASNLWAGNWNPLNAGPGGDGIKVKIMSETIGGSGDLFWDFIQVRVTFTEEVNTFIKLNIGKVTLNTGKIIIS